MKRFSSSTQEVVAQSGSKFMPSCTVRHPASALRSLARPAQQTERSSINSNTFPHPFLHPPFFQPQQHSPKVSTDICRQRGHNPRPRRYSLPKTTPQSYHPNHTHKFSLSLLTTRGHQSLTTEMSDDENHETFEATGAGASMTYPMQVGTTCGGGAMPSRGGRYLEVDAPHALGSASKLFANNAVLCAPQERSRRHQGPPLQGELTTMGITLTVRSSTCRLRRPASTATPRSTLSPPT